MGDHGGVRRFGWLALVVLAVPLSATLWMALAGVWLAIWGAGNLAIAARDQSPQALVRGIDGAARSAGIAGLIASGWGQLAPVIPRLAAVSDAGKSLRILSEAGVLAAPVIPAALGQEGSRSYLFTTLNDAELFGSGGAPLNALVVRVDSRDVTIPVSGSVSLGLNRGNVPYAWKVDGGLPWYRPGAEYPFANSNFHPHFPTSGRNMVTAWNALGYEHIDGVITIDVSAVACVLRAIGPL